MNHQSIKAMLFHFLSAQDYNTDSRQMAHDNGYDLGDYRAPAGFHAIARDCAQLLRTRLVGVFDENGNIISKHPEEPWRDK